MARRFRAVGVVLVTLVGCSGAKTGTGAAESGDARGGGSAKPSASGSPAVPAVRATQVAAGTNHSCALLENGTVACWGKSDRGQLGAAASYICEVPDSLHGGPPMRVPCRASAAPVVGLNEVVQIAVAGSTSCARRKDGTVRCWGDNRVGMVGDGTTTDRAAATEVSGLSNVAQIELSDTHACARLADGTLRCWGGNFFGQLGMASGTAADVTKLGYGAVKELVPVSVPGLGDVVEVAVGTDVTCARRKSGQVVCFGKVAPGTRGTTTPAEMTPLRGASELALGHQTHCAMMGSAMECWGAQSVGPMLGKGAGVTPVPGTAASGISALVLSATRACAVVGAGAAGDVLCWGDDGKGVAAPARSVALPVQATEVALGARHGCALGKDGSVWCWGDSFYGEAGARSTQSAPTSRFWTPPRRAVL